MKTTALLAIVLILCASVPAAAASSDLVVAIDNTTQDAWTSVVSSFEQMTGAAIKLEPRSASSIPQLIALQAYRSEKQMNLVMVPRAWASMLARYLVDLSSYSSVLGAQGADPVSSGTRVVGVPIPFAEDWILAVVSWPSNQQLALDFLVAVSVHDAAATGSSSATATATAYGKDKIARSDHNPILDGSLEVLLGAVEQTLGSVATQLMSALPASARSAVANLANLYGIPFTSSTSSVTVVIESSPGRSGASNVAALGRLGVDVGSIETSSSLIKISVPISQLSSIATELTGIAFIRPPYVPYPLGTTSQGVAAIGADAFHSSGNRGAGTKIAIIDLGFSGLSQAQSRGDLPYTVNSNDLTGTGLSTGITHGTAVAEIAHDVAPDAELYLIKIADEVDLDLAVTYCLSNGIDVINHSLGWYNTNFYDGTGTIADIAKRAVNGGILWVNAAGNEAESHWEGYFSDGNSDGWHDQDITFYASSGSQVVLYFTWNDWPQASSDYDLYLFDPASNLLASSTKHQTGTEEPTESINVATSASGTYRIRFQGSGSERLELFSLYQELSPNVSSSSILAPANVSEVVSVAAIDYSAYAAGPQEPYSSQGPTNDGRIKPDLAGPDNVSTGTAPYTTFPGTSGAAPHVAGAAALLLAANPSLSEPALRAELLTHTVPMGSPYVYGNGRLELTAAAPANTPPTAAFTVSPSSGMPGTTFTYNASSSYDVDGSIVSYQWSFGDGTNSTGLTAQHAYASAGTYSVQLLVRDDDGATDTATKSVVVTSPANQPPNAVFSVSPSSGTPGTTFTYNASGSYDVDGSIVSYQWSFGDGTSGTGLTAQHAYSSAGTYSVQLLVRDDDGATDTATKSVIVTSPANQPPVAAFSVSPSSGSPGTTFTFNASGSYDTDGSIVSYQWSFGDGTSGTGLTAQHAYSSAGTYSVQLLIRDDDGSTDIDTRSIQVQTAAMPDLTVESFTASPTNPTLGQTITFTIRVRNAGNASAGTFRVRLTGSSSSVQNYVFSLSSGASQTLYLTLPLSTSPETFTVTADDIGQVSESNESNNQSSLALSAAATPVLADAGGPYSGTAGSAISFDASGSTGPVTSYVWSFGDGGTASGMTPSHTYASPGTYTVSLTVYGSGVTPATDTAQVSVSAALPPLAVQLSLPQSTYEVGDAIVITFTTNRPAYVYLCEVTPDNRVVLLYPNWIEKTNPVTAGTHTVPGASYTLRASEPTGLETLYLYAATGPISGFPTSFSFAFPVMSTNPSSFHSSVLATMQSQFASGDWAYDALSLNVIAAQPTTGAIRVETSPSGATAKVDGSTIGTTPAERSNLSPGAHTVEVSLSGYYSETRQASVVAGQTTTVQITLNPIPPTTGTIRVETSPSGAAAKIDGLTIGTTPAERSNVSPGTHTVEVSLSGYYTETRQASVVAGQTTTVQITLNPIPVNETPVCNFSYTPTSLVPGNTVQFDASASYDPDGTIVTYTWDLGDGTTATGVSPSHRYIVNGKYSVELEVTDNEGKTKTRKKTVTVSRSPEVGWVSPIAHEDPADNWRMSQRTYDENLDFDAYTNPGGKKQWGSFLFLSAPGAGLQSERVRFMAHDTHDTYNAIIWDVDVERDGQWVDVFEDYGYEFEWTELSFNQGLVTRVRLRPYTALADSTPYLIEVDFHDITAVP